MFKVIGNSRASGIKLSKAQNVIKWGSSYNLVLKSVSSHIISGVKSTPIPAAHPLNALYKKRP